MSGDIVYVDDEPGPLVAEAVTAGARARLLDRLPADLDNVAVAATDPNLWVFDFFNTPADDEQAGLEQAAANGMSKFQELRYLVGDFRPPAVLVSNDLELALGTDIVLERRHILAEQLGVEWIAPKTFPDGRSNLSELLAIADAVKSIRKEAAALRDVEAAAYVAEFAHRVLALPRKAGWSTLAIRDVSAWRPPGMSDTIGDHRPEGLRDRVPVHRELRATRAIVAWLIRQALPYPSFVVSRRHVAVRLGITIDCLDAALGQDTPLRRKCARMSYKGVLRDLGEDRWWSAAIDGLAWSLPRPRPERTAALAALVAPVVLDELGMVDPVVLSDADLVETDHLAPAAECVRISDENFPPNAPPAWVRIEDAIADRTLARRVRIEDQERLVVEA